MLRSAVPWQGGVQRPGGKKLEEASTSENGRRLIAPRTEVMPDGGSGAR